MTEYRKLERAAREPRKAKPDPNADLVKIAEEFTARYPRTLEYLGR